MPTEQSGSNATAEYGIYNDVNGNQYNPTLNQTFQGPMVICKSFY